MGTDSAWLMGNRCGGLWILQKPVFLEFILQRAAADTQRFGSFLTIAGDVRECLADQHPLDFRKRCSRTNGESCRITVKIAQEIRQLLDLDNRLRASDDQPF